MKYLSLCLVLLSASHAHTTSDASERRLRDSVDAAIAHRLPLLEDIARLQHYDAKRIGQFASKNQGSERAYWAVIAIGYCPGQEALNQLGYFLNSDYMIIRGAASSAIRYRVQRNAPGDRIPTQKFIIQYFSESQDLSPAYNLLMRSVSPEFVPQAEAALDKQLERGKLSYGSRATILRLMRELNWPKANDVLQHERERALRYLEKLQDIQFPRDW